VLEHGTARYVVRVRISMPKRQSKTEHEGKKMNALIKELTEQLPVASDVQKSIANRLESALTKTGSASSRLRMASQSLNALANKYEADTDENGYADLFARIFAIGAAQTSPRMRANVCGGFLTPKNRPRSFVARGQMVLRTNFWLAQGVANATPVL
jgi:hypothetical protein